MQLTVEAAKRIEQLPRYLHAEFPAVPLATIEHDIDDGVRGLITSAHFDDYVPLLVHKTVRQHLRDYTLKIAPPRRTGVASELEEAGGGKAVRRDLMSPA